MVGTARRAVLVEEKSGQPKKDADGAASLPPEWDAQERIPSEGLFLLRLFVAVPTGKTKTAGALRRPPWMNWEWFREAYFFSP